MGKIKRLRIEAGVSQQELARQLQVKQSHYSNIENDVYKDKDNLKDMAVDILFPIFMKKLHAQREELERLESFSLQFNRIEIK